MWTNREATSTREIPGRAVVIGGGPNCIETSQWLSRLGSSVTLVEHSGRLLDREEPQAGKMIQHGQAVASELRQTEDQVAVAERLRAVRDSLASCDPVHAEWCEDPDALHPGQYLTLGGPRIR